MKAKQSSRLVIDASIARASGGVEAVHPTATIVRDFLQQVLRICHRAVMTPALKMEWDKHESNFARKWRRSMVARKKLILLDLPERSDLRKAVYEGLASESEKSAMSKDFLLVEAAIATDERIVSLDDKVKALFSAESTEILALRNIVWINPDTNPAGAMALLKGEASQRQWTLAAMSKDI